MKLIQSRYFSIALILIISLLPHLHSVADDVIDADPNEGLGVIRFSVGREVAFPATTITHTQDLSLKILHNGKDSVTLLGYEPPYPFHYKGGVFPGEGGNCKTEILHDCEIVLSFSPHETRHQDVEFRITYVSGNFQLTSFLRVTGNGLSANLAH